MKRWLLSVPLLLVAAFTPAAQAQANCAIVPVQTGSGIYFLAVTNGCGTAPEGYQLISDLIRDDGGSHVLIIVENPRNDAETRSIAGTLSNMMRNGGVDGHLWKPAPEPSPVPPSAEEPAPVAEPPAEGEQPMDLEPMPEQSAPAPDESAPPPEQPPAEGE